MWQDSTKMDEFIYQASCFANTVWPIAHQLTKSPGHFNLEHEGGCNCTVSSCNPAKRREDFPLYFVAISRPCCVIVPK